MLLTRFGLQIQKFQYPGVDERDIFEHVVKIATVAEVSGFDSLWLMDHFFQIPNVGVGTDPFLESYVTLGAIAARTSSIQLGTLATGVTHRNPALLAKMVTTVDRISGGRAILGIGAGWNEREHRSYGMDFPSLKVRFERLRETLKICRAMFISDAPSFEGDHFAISNALNYPRPFKLEGIPILIAGNGEQKTLRLVAELGDACNVFGDVDTVKRKLDALNRHCELVGRDPKDITKTCKVSVAIARTRAEANRKLGDIEKVRRANPARHREHLIWGDADSVIEQVKAFIDVGVDGMIISLDDVGDTEMIELAGNTLRNAALF